MKKTIRKIHTYSARIELNPTSLSIAQRNASFRIKCCAGSEKGRAEAIAYSCAEELIGTGTTLRAVKLRGGFGDSSAPAAQATEMARNSHRISVSS